MPALTHRGSDAFMSTELELLRGLAFQNDDSDEEEEELEEELDDEDELDDVEESNDGSLE